MFRQCVSFGQSSASSGKPQIVDEWEFNPFPVFPLFHSVVFKFGGRCIDVDHV